MELYHTYTEADKFLSRKAAAQRIPLGGTFELSPLCNMHCRMCYVVHTRTELDQKGRLLSCDEWLRVADEGMEQGLLFLLLTGGEPLLYPEFQRLFTELNRRGLVLSVNTNGTLIDERWADFFAEQGVRGISMTLYGKDDETYGRLCGNPKGFTQIMRAATLLKERKVPFRLTCTVTPENAGDLDGIFQTARDLGVSIQTCNYLFPASRRGIDALHQFRQTPEQAAATTMRCHSLMHPETPLWLASRITLDKLNHPPVIANADGFPCQAGKSGFWINWRGDFSACGMLPAPDNSVLERSFRECWDTVVNFTSGVTLSEKCRSCEKQNLCHYCPAACYAETGSLGGCPEYLCRMTDECLRLFREESKKGPSNIVFLNRPKT